MNALEKHVLRLISENVDSPDVFTDDATGMAPIRKSINDALQEMCMITGSYHKTYLLPLYADRQFYRMGWEADFFGWVVDAWDRQRKRRLEQTDVQSLNHFDLWWLKRTGNAYKYIQIGEDILGIYHKPSSNGVVLELDCVCIPKEYTEDTDPIKVRKIYQNAAVYLAVSEYYASRGDAKRGQKYFKDYLEKAGLFQMHPDANERLYQPSRTYGSTRERVGNY